MDKNPPKDDSKLNLNPSTNPEWESPPIEPMHSCCASSPEEVSTSTTLKSPKLQRPLDLPAKPPLLKLIRGEI